MSNKYTGIEIAIVGMACRFPQASDLERYWNNLKNGVEAIVELKEETILAEGEDQQLLHNPDYVKANSFIEDKAYFDAEFFGYRPAEAKLMDPQLRIFHELCWTALEDAGYGARNENNKIGLFAGATTNLNWENYAVLANQENIVDDYTASQLRNTSYLSSRISYLLNLQGPTMYLNTACSTSLVAIQRACMSLLLRECDMALAGGVTINNYTHKGYLYQEGMINSPDGHCRAFDAQANGTVGGEGAGVVVLKRMAEALEDGDHIYAIVKGSAVNNDGKDKTSFTAPSVMGQYKTIIKAINMANIPAQSIGYVEAHGTGTSLGDPIEVEALNLAFGKSEVPYCGLGSVKTNMGHLDIAAGVAGFIKAALTLKHRQIPPSLHFTNPNPKINFQSSPFYINTELQEWNTEAFPLRAGVSSFGIGGTNAHAILEESPKPKATTASRNFPLLVLSAKTEAALSRNINQLKAFLEREETIDLADVAYTLQVGREALKYRKTFVGPNRETIIDLLAADVKGSKTLPAFEPGNHSVVFMFSGQGAQYVNMCRDLYEQEKSFRATVDQCLGIVKKQSGIDLRGILFSEDVLGRDAAINQTQYTQPVLFLIEYALARLLMHWGIQPEVMIGHSIGEYVAACISGVFTLEDALALVVKRGALMQSVAPGQMLSISIAEATLMPILENYPDISLAAVNNAELCVVSGTEEAIGKFQKAMDKEGYTNKIIRTSHAFHSYMMNEILEAFTAEVKKVAIQKQSIPFLSNRSGDFAKDEELAKATYWADHLRHTVQFSKGVEKLLQEKNRIFIEVGPGKTLNTFVRSNPLREKDKHRVVSLVRHPKEEANDVQQLLTGLGALWANGVGPDWKAFYEQETRRRVSLPTYSFDKQAFPVLVDSYRMISQLVSEQQVGKQADIQQWLYRPSWALAAPLRSSSSAFKGDTLIFLDDHGIGEDLAEKISAAGERVICVKKGKAFAETSPELFVLNPTVAEDYQQLFARLLEHNKSPERIIHAWGISTEQQSSFSESTYDSCFYSLVHSIRQLQNHGGFSNKQVVVVTNGVHNISNDASRPMAAISQALLKVAAQENSGIITSHIDISLTEATTTELANQLYREVLDLQKGKTISLRQSCRWEPIYKSIQPQTNPPKKLRAKGVYLITGGLGDLGYQLAHHLQSKLEAKVILTGRAKNLSSAKAERLNSLQQGKGEVLYYACDISDKTAFAKLVEEVEATLGNLNGVFHVAGIVSGDSINLMSQLEREDYAAQGASKINGLLTLKEVLENKPLDFCLLASSLSAVLGGLRFAAYASANIFMDYYIRSCRAVGKLDNWISVNFDGLNFTDTNTREINAHELYDLLELLLANAALPQVVVSTTDLKKALDQWVYQTEAGNENQLEMDGDSSTDSLIALPEAASFSDVENALLLIWRDFFGKSDLDLDDDFFDIGGDSLKALTIIGRINKELHTNLSVTDFFRLPTIRKLSAEIFQTETQTGALANQSTTTENQEEFIF